MRGGLKHPFGTQADPTDHRDEETMGEDGSIWVLVEMDWERLPPTHPGERILQDTISSGRSGGCLLGLSPLHAARLMAPEGKM
jgi:hypothetical protein